MGDGGFLPHTLKGKIRGNKNGKRVDRRRSKGERKKLSR